MENNKKIEKSDIVSVELTDKEIAKCAMNASMLLPHVIDRSGLHPRDPMEKFNNIFMGEVAEMMVIKWFRKNGKFAISAVNKNTSNPDLGHDIYLISKNKKEKVFVSVKSSIDSCDIETIINKRRPAFKGSEFRDLNVQVYFQLKLSVNKEIKNDYRISVPSLKMANLISWFTKEDLNKSNLTKLENRECTDTFLKDGRTLMSSLKYAADYGEFKEKENEIRLSLIAGAKKCQPR